MRLGQPGGEGPVLGPGRAGDPGRGLWFAYALRDRQRHRGPADQGRRRAVPAGVDAGPGQASASGCSSAR